MRHLKLTIVVAIALLFLLLVAIHAPGVNGPWYWKWSWRRADAWPVYTLLPIAALPVFMAQWIVRSTRGRRFIAIALIMLGSLALRYASVFVQTRPPSFDLIPAIIRHDYATSYYTDAITLSKFDGWFGAYDRILTLPQLHLHTQTKPPGAVLFFATIIRIFGETDRATQVAAAILGLLAVLALPATYVMIKQLTGDTEAAFSSASFMSLCPGFALFFPMFDPVYSLISCAIIGLWAAAVRNEKIVPAATLGAVLAITCVVTFNVLVLGFFCAIYPFITRVRLALIVRQAAIAIATAIVLLGALWLATGYNPILTFRSAWINQHALLTQHASERPYPTTILFDLTDFALGSGWISLVLVAFYFLDRSEARRAVAWLVLAQVAVVAIMGLLQAETARVWNFMLSLLMIPIGLELRQWTTAQRAAVLLMLLAITCAICQNMKFIL